MSRIHSMRDFAMSCSTLTSDEIYKLFEYELSQELRDEIYNTFWSDSQEPARAALRQLGIRYCIKSLQDY